MKLKRTLVILDLETTGTWVEKDKIIEIGMVKVRPDGSKEQFAAKVNPGIPIPEEVTALTGISDADVGAAPYFSAIAPRVLSFIEDADFGGFSIEKFDLPLLRRELREAGLDLNMDNRIIYDSKIIYHVNEKRDLTAAYKFYCDRDLQDAHSALVDAKAALAILEAQVQKYGDAGGSLEPLRKFKYEIGSAFVDGDKKLRLWNGEYYLTFGKYRGKSLNEIVKMDRNYLSWLVGTDMNEAAKTIIIQVLTGKK